VKQLSALIIGFAASFAFAPALAEDLTAGKTPAQLFRSDCGACHRSPNGLVKERGNISGLTDFLRAHYTTKAESAAALAAYVSGLASPGGGSARSSRGDRRGRSEGAAPVTTAAVPTDSKPADSKPADDQPARRRRAASQPDDAGKRRVRNDGDVPRPPRDVTTASPQPAAGSNPATRISQPQEAADPLARLRSYLSSGLDAESASAQAAGTRGAPKARKRRPAAEETATGAAAPTPENAGTAAAAPRATVPAEAASETPQGAPQ
jgi:hypothetical protein